MLATYAGAAILRPNRKQIAFDRSGHVNGRDMTQRRVERFGQANPIPIVSEDGEPLVGIGAYPDRVGAETIQRAKPSQARRFGALADDGDIRPQAHERIELAIERHTAIPGHKSHVRASAGLGWHPTSRARARAGAGAALLTRPVSERLPKGVAPMLGWVGSACSRARSWARRPPAPHRHLN